MDCTNDQLQNLQVTKIFTKNKIVIFIVHLKDKLVTLISFPVIKTLYFIHSHFFCINSNFFLLVNQSSRSGIWNIQLRDYSVRFQKTHNFILVPS